MAQFKIVKMVSTGRYMWTDGNCPRCDRNFPILHRGVRGSAGPMDSDIETAPGALYAVRSTCAHAEGPMLEEQFAGGIEKAQADYDLFMERLEEKRSRA